jgi:hypothetical protein
MKGVYQPIEIARRRWLRTVQSALPDSLPQSDFENTPIWRSAILFAIVIIVISLHSPDPDPPPAPPVAHHHISARPSV